MARVGDGWQPIRLSPEALHRGLENVRQHAAELGRDVSNLAVSVRGELHFTAAPRQESAQEAGAFIGTADEIIATIQAYERAGTTHIVLSMNTGDTGQVLTLMERFAHEVMPTFAT